MNSAGQAAPMDFNRIVNGVIRAARLDRTFFKEIEGDTSYTQDALVVVIAVSLISAIGAFLGGLLLHHGFLAVILSFIWTAVWGVIGFYLWVYLVTWVGTKFFKGQGDAGEVQRCLGFAYGPQLLGILQVIPCLGALASLIGWVWSMVAGFFAIQEALDQDTTNALLTVVISAVIVFVIGSLIGGILVGGAVLGGALTGK
ncbi:MAG TPA: Yip1 family protein [Anaerolineae bacterium]